MSLVTLTKIRTLQRKLYTKAKQEPAYRFYALYDKIHGEDVLYHAWCLVRSNQGEPGVDGMSFEAIEHVIGVDKFLLELAQKLKDKTYLAQAVRRVMIPKEDGSYRPLGIPTIHDRVAQMAVKLIIEPIFEADFCPNSYGFRPKKSAHDAIDDIANTLWAGYTQVIDADLSKYFDSIPHAKLMSVVAERIVDGGILHLCKQDVEEPLKVVRHVLERLELSLNETKTHIVDANQNSFNFLGFAIQMRHGIKTGKPYPNVRPADKLLKKIKGKRLIVSVIPCNLSACQTSPTIDFLGISYDSSRKHDHSRLLATAYRSMASLWLVPSQLLPPANITYTPV